MNGASRNAFPRPEVDNGRNGNTKAHEGMTLRDYFAGQALADLAGNPDYPSWEVVAESAYKAADAMIKESNK